MSNIMKYNDLFVWKKAHKFVLDIYKITYHFPQEEKYGLIQQIRRSASSVPANIAEGYERYSKKEYISRGSLSETDYHLCLAKDLGYISIAQYTELKKNLDEIGKMCNGLISSLKNASIN